MAVTGATLGVSVAITFLPDDYASPLADTLADMSTYFVILLGMILFEKLLIMVGVPFIFRFIIPAGIILLIVYYISHKKIIRTIAYKILAFAIVIILAVPLGTSVSKWLCSSSLDYVNETVTQAQDGSDKIEEISESSSSDKSFYETVSSVFDSAIEGVTDLFNYYKGIIQKFINTIAIMMLAYLVVPFVTFLLMLWFMNQLFLFESFRDKGYSLTKDDVKAIKKISEVCNEKGEPEDNSNQI
ncbi:hypothetical protein [Butyrivibrio fibrisolvens]|uniref:hypothetical protein n=1 Tax=Butyrivibrio fibrisolvens TaxID=831 RepID=UPI000404C792|nr:hypothetical protein [Butyrivibrio fibrisolvens]